MKNILSNINSKFGAFFACLLLLLATGSNALAVAGPVETAATAAIGEAKTAGEAILVVAIGVIAAFILFKLVKRAASKA